jgi:DNA-binding transcriptional LysR family regulator
MKHSFMISPHRLEGFYRAAHAGGFARAARAYPYPITAPAVYQQVRKLEDELGVTLLQRTGKDRLTLTSAGRTLYDFCEPFFRELPNVVRTLSEGRHGGLLRIDAAALEVQHFLPSWLARLARARPDIRVQVDEVAFGDPTRVLRGDADLLVEYQPTLAPGLAAHPVGHYHAFLVAPAGTFTHCTTQSGAARALRDHTFVGFPNGLPQRVLQEHALDRLHLTQVPRGLTASSTEALLAFIRANLGFSLLPWPTPKGPHDHGIDALPLRGAGTKLPVTAAYRAKPIDPLVQAALTALPTRTPH